MVTTTDETERIIQWAETKFELSFQTAHIGQKDPATEEAQAMKVWTAALNDETDDNDEIEDVRKLPGTFWRDWSSMGCVCHATPRDYDDCQWKNATATMMTESMKNTVEHTIVDFI